MWGFDLGFSYGEECDTVYETGNMNSSDTCTDYGNGGLRCKGADKQISEDYGTGFMHGFDSGFSYGSAEGGCQRDDDDGTSGDD